MYEAMTAEQKVYLNVNTVTDLARPFVRLLLPSLFPPLLLGVGGIAEVDGGDADDGSDGVEVVAHPSTPIAAPPSKPSSHRTLEDPAIFPLFPPTIQSLVPSPIEPPAAPAPAVTTTHEPHVREPEPPLSNKRARTQGMRAAEIAASLTNSAAASAELGPPPAPAPASDADVHMPAGAGIDAPDEVEPVQAPLKKRKLAAEKAEAAEAKAKSKVDAKEVKAAERAAAKAAKAEKKAKVAADKKAKALEKLEKEKAKALGQKGVPKKKGVSKKLAGKRADRSADRSRRSRVASKQVCRRPKPPPAQTTTPQHTHAAHAHTHSLCAKSPAP
jgi:hypothetical protein